MKDVPILTVALPVPLRRLFDYLAPQVLDFKKLKPGMRILVPFQRRKLVGVLIEVKKKSSLPYHKLKTIIEVLDREPLITKDVFKLCQWAADYYHHAQGEVLIHAFPTLLRKVNKLGEESFTYPEQLQDHTESILKLNQAQKHAVETILDERNFKVFALDGITGSGKTEVYLRVIEKIVKQGKQALVLVPEISLTPQTIARFTARFKQLVVSLHSSLTDKERLHAWQAARKNEAAIVIGTRSAVFTSLPKIGIIIVDEEHDLSFKQQDRFRYHARDLAIMRANLNNIPVVLGSATLSLETLYNIERGRYHLISLPERAGIARLPTYQVLDLRQSKSHEEGLSFYLMEAIRSHLEQDNQVMLFLNKRGFAPVLYCCECTWVSNCDACAVRMVYHYRPKMLQCHYCDARKKVPEHCPQCSSSHLIPIGLGTQRVEAYLAERFPAVPIIRMDRDTTQKKGSLQNLLARIHTKERAILLGTQMLAKGHHFPNVTLVGILDADSGLFSADYRSAEQMGQLLLQVSGRAGRAEKEGIVIVQTRNPENPLLKNLLYEGYQTFADTLLKERKAVSLPPYAFFALIRAESREEQAAEDFLQKLKTVSHAGGNEIKILGPVPALIAKRKGYYCQHLIIKSHNRPRLHLFLKCLLTHIEKCISTKVKWLLEVDPVSV